jgi:hypothetical protein
MFDLVFCKSKDLGDMLRFLPGVVVQNYMSMQGMADLYRIKPELLERLVKSTFELLTPSNSHGRDGPYSPGPLPVDRCIFKLDDYSSGFLQDRDRSQLYYCNPILQHISICRHFLSLLDGSHAFDLQS